MKQQYTPMKFNPNWGSSSPDLYTAAEWREYRPDRHWVFNPWTGEPRDKRDMESDPMGLLIVPPNESVFASI